MKTIGIIGGMGPEAGLDLHRKILEETVADRDQDHLEVVHLSFSGLVDDRTAWLLNQQGRPPSRGIIAMAHKLEQLKVSVAAVPCNTAHAAPIMGMVRFMLREAKFKLKLLDMIRETGAYLTTTLPTIKQVGLLATNGTCRIGVYADALKEAGIQVITPDGAVQQTVHNAIYDPTWGIKKIGGVNNHRAHETLSKAATQLVERGAEAVILGCTELPLVLTEKQSAGVPTVDPTRILARALIHMAAPEKLRQDS